MVHARSRHVRLIVVLGLMGLMLAASVLVRLWPAASTSHAQGLDPASLGDLGQDVLGGLDPGSVAAVIPLEDHPWLQDLVGPQRTPPDCQRVACVALTFDDGPDPAHTPRLLDILEDRGAAATFFVLGHKIAGQEHVLQRMARLGMEVENHTWDHPNLTALTHEAALGQIERTAGEIDRVTGQRSAFLRPPGGRWTEGVTPAGGHTLMMWDVDPKDWLVRDRAAVVRSTLDLVGPGDVILLHDIHGTTVDAVPEILDGLEDRGLVPATLREMSRG